MSFKKLAISAFKSQNYELAKSYLSLAKDEMSVDELDFLLSLCLLANEQKTRANELFLDYISSAYPDFDYLLNCIKIVDFDDTKNSINELLLNDATIDYSEFRELLKNSKDKDIDRYLLSIMTSTKLIIKNKFDLLDFIDLLVKNGKFDLAIKYIVMMAELYSWDEKIDELINKIKENETRNYR